MEEDTVVGLPRRGGAVGDDPLLAVLRDGARRMLTQTIEAEVTGFLAAHADRCDDHGRRRLVRNGHAPERTIQTGIGPIALNRKNALFAGSDQGGVHWGVIASLIETCKLNAVDPQADLASTLTRLINRHPASQIDQLMPWAYANPVV